MGTPLYLSESERLAAFHAGWAHAYRGQEQVGYYIGRPHPPYTECRVVRSLDKVGGDFIDAEDGEPGQVTPRCTRGARAEGGGCSGERARVGEEERGERALGRVWARTGASSALGRLPAGPPTQPARGRTHHETSACEGHAVATCQRARVGVSVLCAQHPPRWFTPPSPSLLLVPSTVPLHHALSSAADHARQQPDEWIRGQ